MRTRKNKEAMFAIVEQWQESGLSQSEFSREHKLNKKTLNNWIKQYNISNTKPTNNFIPVISEIAAKNSGSIFLRYPNGIEIEFPATVDFKQLKQLISL